MCCNWRPAAVWQSVWTLYTLYCWEHYCASECAWRSLQFTERQDQLVSSTLITFQHDSCIFWYCSMNHQVSSLFSVICNSDHPSLTGNFKPLSGIWLNNNPKKISWHAVTSYLGPHKSHQEVFSQFLELLLRLLVCWVNALARNDSWRSHKSRIELSDGTSSRLASLWHIYYDSIRKR